METVLRSVHKPFDLCHRSMLQTLFGISRTVVEDAIESVFTVPPFVANVTFLAPPVWD